MASSCQTVLTVISHQMMPLYIAFSTGCRKHRVFVRGLYQELPFRLRAGVMQVCYSKQVESAQSFQQTPQMAIKGQDASRVWYFQSGLLARSPIVAFWKVLVSQSMIACGSKTLARSDYAPVLLPAITCVPVELTRAI